MKKVILLILILSLPTTFISAQASSRVSQTLTAQTVSLNDVSYYASVYLGINTEAAAGSTARAALEEYFDFSKIESNTDPLTYADFAYFCTEAWNIKGGLMLRVTKAPRYAFLELQSLGYIPQNVQPTDLISGRDALTIITNCIDYSIEKNTINLDDY